MQRTVRFSAIAAIIPAWLLSVAILISAAQAQDTRKTRTALACGKELKKQCSGVPVLANNILECLQKNQENFPRDALHGPTTLCAAVIGMQRNFAKTSSRVRAIFSDA